MAFPLIYWAHVQLGTAINGLDFKESPPACNWLTQLSPAIYKRLELASPISQFMAFHVIFCIYRRLSIIENILGITVIFNYQCIIEKCNILFHNPQQITWAEDTNNL